MGASFVIGEGGQSILRIGPNPKRVYAPLFEVCQDTPVADETSTEVLAIANGLREALQECVEGLLGAAREENPRVNQIVLSVRTPPTVLYAPQVGSKDPYWSGFTCVALIAQEVEQTQGLKVMSPNTLWAAPYTGMLEPLEGPRPDYAQEMTRHVRSLLGLVPPSPL